MENGSRKICFAPGMFPGRRGFTLVEILVASTLFALIGVSLASSFLTGMKVWNRISNPRRYQYHKAVLGLVRLTRDVCGAYNDPGIGFNGNQAAFDFARIIDGNICKVSYWFSPQDHALYRKQMILDAAGDVVEESAPRVIIPAVREARFAYYRLPVPCVGLCFPNFFDTSDYNRSGLPLSVRVTLIRENGYVLQDVVPLLARAAL